MTLASRRREIKWGKTAQHGQGNPNFNGGQYIDDKGYIRVLKPDHPHENHGYVYMHRLVMEAFFGRYLRPEETIHHINEEKLDNRVDNLYLCDREEHAVIHRGGKRKNLKDKSHMRRKAKARGAAKRPRNASGQFMQSDTECGIIGHNETPV